MLIQEAATVPGAGGQRVEVGVSEPRALEERPPQSWDSDLQVGSARHCGDTRRLVPGVCVKNPGTGTSSHCQDAEVLLG